MTKKDKPCKRCHNAANDWKNENCTCAIQDEIGLNEVLDNETSYKGTPKSKENDGKTIDITSLDKQMADIDTKEELEDKFMADNTRITASISGVIKAMAMGGVGAFMHPNQDGYEIVIRPIAKIPSMTTKREDYLGAENKRLREVLGGLKLKIAYRNGTCSRCKDEGALKMITEVLK